MYSPFLFDLVWIGLPPLSTLRRLIVAPSTGWPWASVTLPLIDPLCANAGAATHASPRARTEIATARRMVAPVMESSIVQGRPGLLGPGGLLLYRPYTGRRTTLVMRYSRTGPRFD